MTDASSRSAGYALKIEENPDQKIRSKRKTYAPVAMGRKIFSPAQLRMSTFSKKVLAIYKAFLQLAHILCEAIEPTNVLTDNKLVRRFFQTKAMAPALWNVMWLRITIYFQNSLHRRFNKHCGWLCLQLELEVTEKIRLKIGEDIQKTPIEVTTSSSDVADEQQFFLTQGDKEDESEEQTLERKEQSRQNAKQWVLSEETPSFKTRLKTLQRSTETLRRIPWMELMHMRQYE